ncbi:methionyl-tRNA formyltransferase, partial [Pseudactinotalea sp.]|uniref:methionyl-tRNA formyltransferase n=1 Tax=Pseudactinotalea sp. TaxID=1926260 RepID=UPI003B3AEA90
MRVLFAGTPAVAVPALDALLSSDHDVVGVLTRPPAPHGRKRVMTPSPVHERALEAGLPVITSNKPHADETVGELRSLGADVAAVVAYGALLREPALSLLEHGWVNLHFSLLPAWRGAAPVQHALMAGDEITGASTFRIEAGLDTGPVYGSMTESIRPIDTAGTLLDRLSTSAAPLLVGTLDAIADGSAQPVPQSVEGVCMAPQLTSADAEIDWRLPGHVIDRRIRGLTPAPGAWSTHETARFKIGPVVPTMVRMYLAPGAVRVGSDGVLVGTG